MAIPMKFSHQGFGMTQFAGEDIVLAGGMRSDKPGTPGTARLRYAVYDRAKIGAGTPAEQCMVGKIEVNVRPDGDIEGVVNLEIAKPLRRQGIGRRVVRAVAATSAEGLRVYDIKASAAKFWRQMGCDINAGRGQVNGSLPAPAAEPGYAPAPPGMG